MLLGLAAIVTLLVAYHLWFTYRYEKQLENLINQIAAEDPQWHWDGQLAKRHELNSSDNSAVEIVELLKLTTLRETIGMANRNEWGKAYSQLYSKESFEQYEEFVELHPNARLPEPMREKMQPLMEMAPMPEVLQRARKLRHYQAGRFDHTFKPLLMMSLLPDVQGTRAIGNLLAWDADWLVWKNKLPTALESIQSMLGICRSFSDDPFLISQLVRMALAGQAGKETMRLLAQSQTWKPDQLRALQSDFEREHELAKDVLERMLRSDRAVLDHDLQVVLQNKVTYLEISRMYGRRIAWSTGYAKIDEALVGLFPEMVLGWGNRPGNLLKERYDLLRFYTQAVSWSRMPEHEWLSALDAWAMSGPYLTPFLRQFFFVSMLYGGSNDPLPELMQLRKLAYAGLKSRARLRSISALLACERYRLENGGWPTNWEVLCPKYLKQVPVDPFTGQPMLLKLLPDGLVVYAIGDDGKDNGGHVLRTTEGVPRDIGYRLWNVPQRGLNLDKECFEFVKDQKKE